MTGGGRQGRTGSKIRDVAKQAGVSVGTVSHVLNRPEIVRPDLRERVLRVIEELDYRPNAVAKSLRLRRTMTIALVLSDITTPFASAVARAVQDRAATTGMSVLFADTDEDPAREALAVRTFYDKGVDGLILAPTAGGHRFLEPYMAGGWPMVAINRRPEGVRLPAVLSDNTGGAAAATRHLLDHGHRRIGVVTRRDPLSSVQDRLEGYRRALLAAGTRPDPALVVEETASLEGGASAVSRLLAARPRPTAVVSLSSAMTLGTIVGLREHGVRVPEGMALVGFDDAIWSAAVSPPLTSVALAADTVGREAARLLLDWIGDETPPERIDHQVATSLVLRESCGCLPGRR